MKQLIADFIKQLKEVVPIEEYMHLSTAKHEIKNVDYMQNSCLSAIISMNIMRELMFKPIIIVFHNMFSSK